MLRAAAGDRGVLRDAETDARRVARGALLRAFRWATGGAFVLGAAALLAARGLGNRSLGAGVAWLLAPPLCAAALSAIVLVRVQGSFDSAAFRSPSFYARGAELGQLLEVADKAEGTAGRYRTAVHRTLDEGAVIEQQRGDGRKGYALPGR